MATSQTLMWEVIKKYLPKGIFVDLQAIYKIVKREIQLEDDDYEPAAKSTDSYRWERNVRNALQHRKKTGEIIWDGNGKYMIP